MVHRSTSLQGICYGSQYKLQHTNTVLSSKEGEGDNLQSFQLGEHAEYRPVQFNKPSLATLPC